MTIRVDGSGGNAPGTPGVPGVQTVRCVLYAAKSTADIRESIPHQLLDCRNAVDGAGNRLIVDEYSDETRSAYLGDRGEGLASAMQHVENLVREYGTAELWAQHSDRLARGDGRIARHVVELALWALKRGVRIRTLQDPETFRDLLYAVVTGERNHEDSRRKGLASAAGRRRATERGEYVGHKADGYRLVVEVDPENKVIKRLEIDPEREPILRMLFRLALRGRTSGQVARSLNEAGWLTKPRQKGRQPQPWHSSGVLVVLHNPRYAGLSVTGGEIVGQGQWPAYITVRQHERLQALIARRLRERRKHAEAEAFLLSRVATCGRCGAPLLCHTGVRRADGTFSRRYICRSHWRDRHRGRCDAKPLDADVIESMVASSLPHLLHENAQDDPALDLVESFDGHWTEAPERERLREAVICGDDFELDRSIEQMVVRVAPDLAIQRRAAAAREQARQEDFERRFAAWLEIRWHTDPVETRPETNALNRLLREWVSEIRIHDTVDETILTALRRPLLENGPGQSATTVGLPRRAWARALLVTDRSSRRPATWSNEEIIAALQDWAATHGRSPNSCEWLPGSPDRPGSLCVRRRFGSWEKALRRAGLKPNIRTQHRFWTDREILDAIRGWTRCNGRPPRHKDWVRAGQHHPCALSVAKHFGSFNDGLAAAGFGLIGKR